MCVACLGEQSSAQNVCWGSGCKVPVQSRAPESWKPIWALKRKALSYSVNCCKSIRWKAKIWYGPDGRLVPIDGITEGLRSIADKCLLIGNERRWWECGCIIRFFICSYDDFIKFSDHSGQPCLNSWKREAYLEKSNNSSCILMFISNQIKSY